MAPKPPAKNINNGPVDRTNSDKRRQALDNALAQIDKQFGEGSIMRMGDVEPSKLDVIPTSSLALDIALGVGGLPRGRVIEIYGPESSGKCVDRNALVQTNWGTLTVEEIFNKCDMEASCTSRVTDITSYGLKVLNEQGEMESVSHLTHNYRRPVLEITSSTGKSVKVTENHPMRVLNERGWIVWRNAADIKVGDTLIGILGNDPEVEDKITVEEAILLGYLVGDGSYTTKSAFHFSQLDQQVSDEFDSLVAEVFPNIANTGKIYSKNPNDTVYHSTATRTLLAEKGLVATTAPSKTVPWTVRASGPAVQRAFLSALYECDGGIEGSNVCLSTASKQLATEIQVMLAGLGLVSSVTTKKVKAYPDNTYYTVSMGSASSLAFLNEIGFRSDRRALQVENAKLGKKDAYRHIPHMREMLRDFRDAVGGDRAFSDITDGIFRDWKNPNHSDLKVSRETLQKVIDWAIERGVDNHPICQNFKELAAKPATYESVVSIEPAGEEPTFDLVVPGTHSFVANGLATHNTTLTLHAAANCQKQGGVVAFIDAEHALDPIYAANIGVDLDELYVSQPDTGEQALEIVDMLIRSGGVDLVIVDSVAALTPRAEIEGEMGDSHMGLQARLMSQALRKITGGLNQTETTIIFINQLRDKIGVMFGCFQYDTEVTLADGSQMAIGRIVEEKISTDVLSYDFATEQIVARPVVGWFDNGITDEFLDVSVVDSDGSVTVVTVTSNHMVMTPSGWEEAGLLEVGDSVTMHSPISTGAGEVDGNVLALPTVKTVTGRVMSVKVASPRENMHRYDIQVDGAHNYFVGGLLVHNSPETTTGGKALKFYASVRMDIRRIETLKEGADAVGNRTRVKVVKNKVSPPFKQAEFDIIFGEGISYEGGIIDLGVDYGIIRKSGAWYTYEGDQLGQGKEKARQFLKDNPELTAELDRLIRVKAGLETDSGESSDVSDAAAAE